MIYSEGWIRLDNILEYSRYTDPHVRALVWSVISEGLVKPSEEFSACVSSQWCRQLYQHLQPFLERLDKEPDELILYLQQQNSWRLGIRFEAYWSFILKQLQKQQLIQDYVEHLQVQDDIRQTRGEMDFVYLDNNKELNHLEVAVKFYLLKPDEFGYERLIGPNGGDWYERKLLHLFKKQLPLSATEDSRAQLAQVFEQASEQTDCHRRGLIKGMIFFPVTGEGSLNEHERQCINEQCLSGSWATIDNWHLADPGQSGRWVILEKLNWLVPQVYSSLQDDLYTGKEMAYKLKVHFHGTKRSILIARLEYNVEHKLWLEQQRVMVVDRYWPTYKRPAKSVSSETTHNQND
jgi:hypothetical protein